MRVDDGLADCQAKAKAVRLRCVKSLEYFLFTTLEPMPIVLDGKPQPDSLVDAHKGKALCSGTIALHGLAGIFDEVQKHLFDGNFVCLYDWKFLRVFPQHLYGGGSKVGLGHPERLIEKRVGRY